MSQFPAVNHAFMLREVRQLRRIGFDVHVVSIRPPDRQQEGLTAEERVESARTSYVKSEAFGKVLRCHLSALLGRPRAYLSGLVLAARFGDGRPKETLSQLLYFAEAVVVGHRMIELGVDHIHSHFSSNVAILSGAVYGISFSMTLHGPQEFAERSRFHVAEKIAACRFACGISDYGCSQMMLMSDSKHWSKLHVARLGVDTRSIQPLLSRDHPDPFRLLCVGRLAPEKAQLLLLKALVEVLSAGRNVHLHLCGDGPDRAALERYVAAAGLGEHVAFEGFLDQDSLQHQYQEADAMVLASFEEGVPVVLMEAMARGIPCISTWIAGVPELLRDGIDGLTVPPGNVRALAEAILKIVDDPVIRRDLAERGRLRAAEIADLQINVDHLARLFEQYLAEAPPSAAKLTGDEIRFNRSNS